MDGNTATRRKALQALAAVPMASLLLRPSVVAAAQATKVVAFYGTTAINGITVHAFGWAAQTPEGWVGQVVDAASSVAMRDFAGTATGITEIVPKGMANTINGHTDKDGVRASSVCFEEVTNGSVEGSKVRLEGKLTHAENPVIFKIGDPMTMEGDADTGELTYTLRGGGKDNVFKMKGAIFVS